MVLKPDRKFGGCLNEVVVVRICGGATACLHSHRIISGSHSALKIAINVLVTLMTS